MSEKNAADGPRLLKAAEAAALCGMARSTWYGCHARGSVPQAVHIGNMPRWRRQELLDWLLAGCPGRDRWRWPKEKTVECRNHS